MKISDLLVAVKDKADLKDNNGTISIYADRLNLVYKDKYVNHSTYMTSNNFYVHKVHFKQYKSYYFGSNQGDINIGLFNAIKDKQYEIDKVCISVMYDLIDTYKISKRGLILKLQDYDTNSWFGFIYTNINNPLTDKNLVFGLNRTKLRFLSNIKELYEDLVVS